MSRPIPSRAIVQRQEVRSAETVELVAWAGGRRARVAGGWADGGLVTHIAERAAGGGGGPQSSGLPARPLSSARAALLRLTTCSLTSLFSPLFSSPLCTCSPLLSFRLLVCLPLFSSIHLLSSLRPPSPAHLLSSLPFWPPFHLFSLRYTPFRLCLSCRSLFSSPLTLPLSFPPCCLCLFSPFSSPSSLLFSLLFPLRRRRSSQASYFLSTFFLSTITYFFSRDEDIKKSLLDHYVPPEARRRKMKMK